MSEYTQSIALCDRCYPDDLPSFTFFPLENVKGVCRGGEEVALEEGWEQRDYGIICPDCVAREAEEEDTGGEVVLGAAALESVTGAQDVEEDA